MVETAPGKCRLRVFVGRDGTGRVQHKNKTFAATKREAQKELATLVADVERWHVAVGHPDRVSDPLQRGIAAIEPEGSAYTAKEYRRLVKIDIAPVLGASGSTSSLLPTSTPITQGCSPKTENRSPSRRNRYAGITFCYTRPLAAPSSGGSSHPTPLTGPLRQGSSDRQ
jgi:hypothetical protein